MKRADRRVFRCAALLGAALLIGAAAGARAADKLRVGKAVGTSWAFTPVDVGIAQGIFAKYGLEIEITNFSGDAKLQQGLMSNSLDVGLGSGPAMAFAVKGAPVVAIAAFGNEPRNFGITVTAASPIKTVADLKGKLVAISTAGSLPEWLVKRLSVSEGWGADGVKSVAIGDAAQQVAALKTRQVDALMIVAEAGYQLEERNEGHVLVTMERYAPHFVTDVIFATKQLVADNPALVDRFLKGFFASMAFVKANREKDIEIAGPILHETAAVLAKTYDSQIPMMELDGQFDPQGLELIKDSFVDLGILGKRPDDDEMLTRRFLPVKP